jgi:hypothetical protein
MTPRSLLQAAASVAATLLAVSFGGCGLDASGHLETAPGSPCVNDAQCSRSADPCSITRCGSLGLCEVIPVPDGDAPAQATADCQRNLCAGGLLIVEMDDADILDDKNDCTVDTCVEGSPQNTPKMLNPPCSIGDADGTCNQLGQCELQCSLEAPGCDDMNPCTTDTCDISTNLCLNTLMDGVPVPGASQMDGNCQLELCVMGVVISGTIDDSDVPFDMGGDCKTQSCVGGVPTETENPLDVPVEICTLGTCVGGVPTKTPVPAGTACGDQLVCNGMGQCVDCVENANCGTDTPCTKYTCVNEVCVVDQPVGDSDVQIAGNCQKLVCDGNGGSITEVDVLDVPADDANPCTGEACDERMPIHPVVPNRTPCGPGVCDGGTCVECYDNDQCDPPETCGGGGFPKLCGCAPLPCPQALECGMVPDGCGGMASCGSCVGFDTCGGGGEANMCGCTVTGDACADQGKNCGMVVSECGGLVGCGVCSPPDSCGGSGVMNVCGCTPNNPCLGKDCGAAVNSCGDTEMCGPPMCPGMQTCTDNVCL